MGAPEAVRTRQQPLGWLLDSNPTSVPRPLLEGPLYTCARAVRVLGAMEGATITIYAVDSPDPEFLGSAVSGPEGVVGVSLNRALALGDQVFAVQTLGSVDSDATPSKEVVDFDGQLPAPLMLEQVWECGRYVVTDGIITGATVDVLRDQGSGASAYGQTIGQGGDQAFWYNASGNADAGDDISAYQFMCDTNDQSDTSAIREVLKAPNPVPPPTEIEALADSRLIRVKGQYNGAFLYVEADGNGIISTIAERDKGNSYALSDALADGATLSAVQSLCGNDSDPLQFQVSTTLNLGAPEIIGPVCPGAPYVAVRAASPQGAIVLDKDATPSTAPHIDLSAGTYTVASAAQGVTWLDTSLLALTTGDVLFAQQVLQPIGGDQSIQSDASAPLAVGVGTRFAIENATTHTDQNTGMLVQGVVREDNAGIQFVYQSCCVRDQNDPLPTVTVESSVDGTYKTITLNEQFPGYYTGTWHWGAPADDPNLLMPPPALNYPDGEVYVAYLDDGCDNNSEQLIFNILTGEVDESDATNATARIDATWAGGAATVTTSNGAATVPANTTLTLLTIGQDDQGVAQVALNKVTGDGTLQGTTTKTALAQPPVPRSLDISPTITLLPTQSVQLRATAQNFNSSTTAAQSGILTLTASQPTPQISDVTPDRVYTNTGGVANTLDIDGLALFYSNLTTEVLFEAADGTTASSTTFASATATKLDDVQIPQTLIGRGGPLELRVKVGAITSAVFTIELLDRPAGFNQITVADLLKPEPMDAFPQGRDCKDANNQDITTTSHPNAIQRFEIYEASSTSPYDYIAKFKRVDGTYATDMEIPFSMGLVNGDPVGGVTVRSDCRLAVVLSHQSGAVANQSYTTTFAYFREDGERDLYGYGASLPGRAYQASSGDPVGFLDALGIWNVFVSKEGSAAVITHGSSVTTNDDEEIPVVSTVIDFKFLTPNLDQDTETGTCSNETNCTFSADLTLGRDVEVFLNSSSFQEHRLGD